MIRQKYRPVFVVVIVLLCAAAAGWAWRHWDAGALKAPGSKVIRTCCQFGYDVPYFIWPFGSAEKLTSFDQLGPHVYLGDNSENNGILYTHRGGFIDMGHLRDYADWTYYLHHQIRKAIDAQRDTLVLYLGTEGGEKYLFVFLDSFPVTDENTIRLAGYMAFQLGIWHEIATWYGVSFIPFIPEQYSSFSPEDLYSNGLGVELGTKALHTPGDYTKNMTQLIHTTLLDLYPVSTIDDTKRAMDKVEGLWWNKDVYLPSGALLIRRYYDIHPPLYPWRLPEDEDQYPPHAVYFDTTTTDGTPLDHFFRFEIRTNEKIPVTRIFGYPKTVLTHRDFDTIIAQIQREEQSGAHLQKHQPQ